MSLPAATNLQAQAAWRGLALSAALLGLTAVLLGAAGSHAVTLDDSAAQHRWDMALQIHYFQAAAIMALAALSATQVVDSKLWLAGWLQVGGTLVFSGSLYLRAAEQAWLPGWITPTGGLILLLGWACTVLVLLIAPGGRS